MNVLLVNPSHPAVKHISGVRAWRFASELAARGHRVILLTAAGPDGSLTAGADLREHDWAVPYVLVPAQLAEATSRLRPALLRRVETGLRMVTSGGYQGAWSNVAVATMRNIGGAFRPNVIWATYGKMEAVLLAKRLARHFQAPWVLDLKDNWELYVPKGLRRLMAWRTRGWARLTANGELTADQGAKWQRMRPSLIYSGVDNVFLQRHPAPANLGGCVALNLIGGLYFDRPLEVLMQGIARWAVARPAGALPIHVHYFGVDSARFLSAAPHLTDRVEYSAAGYVDSTTLSAACQHALANAYIGHPGTFHHKTLELLAAGRPLLVCPGERDESRRLTAQVAGQLVEADTPEAIAQACQRLEAIWQPSSQPLPNPRCERFAWAAQTELLEKVLLDAATR